MTDYWDDSTLDLGNRTVRFNNRNFPVQIKISVLPDEMFDLESFLTDLDGYSKTERFKLQSDIHLGKVQPSAVLVEAHIDGFADFGVDCITTLVSSPLDVDECITTYELIDGAIAELRDRMVETYDLLS